MKVKMSHLANHRKAKCTVEYCNFLAYRPDRLCILNGLIQQTIQYIYKIWLGWDTIGKPLCTQRDFHQGDTYLD